jgi:dTDP-glucose 4,6-dehydratase
LLGCNKKIKQLTDWQPKTSLQEGLAITTEWIKKNLDNYAPGKYVI